MGFGFLAVVGKRQVAPQPRQFDGDGSGQRNAFVGRAKNHVESQAGALLFGQQVARIKLRQPAQLGAIVKQAGIEKIRAHAPGLGLELTKPQHARFDGKLHKFLRQTFASCGGRCGCLILITCLPCRAH